MQHAAAAADAAASRDWIADYLAHLRHGRQLSANTTAAYGRDLAELRTLAEGRDWADIDHFLMRRLTARLHARALDPRSIARKLSSWRGFFDWLGTQTALAANPVQGVRAPKRAKTLPRALSVDDAVQLVAPRHRDVRNGTHDGSASDSGRGSDGGGSSNSGNSSDRGSSSGRSSGSNNSHGGYGGRGSEPAALCNRAMFELLYSSGLRVSELAGLDAVPGKDALGWIVPENREVVVTGKGNKRRVVPVGQAAMAALAAWLAVRPAPADGSAALFLSTRGTRVSPRVIQQRLQAHGVASGAPVHVHPHMLRHSFASHVLQSSGDLRAVQEMLGHASISSTQVYTALDFQRLAEVYDQAHPRAKLK
ncbi:recombinase XerC [Duganella sp. Leaf126]|nr:recombinase XerC [Duganella sp. Leaf126]